MTVYCTIRQKFNDPGIDALAVSSSLRCEALMQSRGDSQIEFPGEMFAWLYPVLGTHFQKSVERGFALFT